MTRHRQYRRSAVPWCAIATYATKTLLYAVLIAALFAPVKGNTMNKKKQGRRLPPAPDTGSPEGDFSAGGTRDNRLQDSWCGNSEQQAAYLLGNRNREFTQTAYPTFWFNLPDTSNEVAWMRFSITELETGKKIYARSISHPPSAGIFGISLPPEQQYALTPETNYSWNLEVQCAVDQKPKVALEGWILRKPSDAQLRNKLASTSRLARHQLYLQHNLWYDALTTLARHHIARPDHDKIKTAWHDLLGELGWQELIHDNVTAPVLLDTDIVKTDRVD